MPARPGYLGCCMRSPSEPHPTKPPVPPPAHGTAGNERSRSAPASPLVSWRIVATAGGIAWLLVGGLTVTVWATSHQPHRVKGRTPVQRNEPPEVIAARNGTALLEPIAKVVAAVVASRGEKQAVERPASFKKAPASPPLSAGEEESVAKEAALPASEVGPGEAATSCRNYGTQVAFVRSPAEAARKALQERKLRFVLHLSGNFEDAKFT